MEKEYGKLSTDQFKRALAQLPEVKATIKELPELVRTTTSEKLRAALDEGIYWAGLYELTFAQHVAFGLYLLGQKGRLEKIAQHEDPQEAMLRFLESDEDIEGRGPDGQELRLEDAIAVVVSFQRTVFSIMLYKQSMSALIEEVRQGHDDSLFKAVRVDRSAVACPSIALRISRAQLIGDRHFFERLRSAVKGPSKRHWEMYSDLRFSLMLLRECGMDSLSDAQLEHLLVDVLKVYPRSFTARKNLRKQYYESKRIKRL